jgi:hypothetical protein
MARERTCCWGRWSCRFDTVSDLASHRTGPDGPGIGFSSGCELIIRPSLLFLTVFRHELFKCRQCLLMMFRKISMDPSVFKKMFHVLAGGS